MNNLKIGVLIGGVVIAITIIGITVLYPNYLNTFIFDVEKELPQKNKENMDEINNNELDIDVRGPPLSTLTKGEEGNYDFVARKAVPHRLEDKANGVITQTGQEETNNFLTTFALGEEGNPQSGPTTTVFGEEGNPVYPPITSNIKGEESTEFNNVINLNHEYDYAGLGVY